MTVINAMRFSKESGGMVADTQGSTDTRKYDLFDKTVVLGERILVGGTGSSSILRDASSKLTRSYAKDHTTLDTANTLSHIFTDSYRSFIDQEMRTRFGFGSKEFTTGRLADGTPIGPHILPTAQELYEGRDRNAQEARQNAFVIIGRDADDCSIYVVPMGSQPYMWPVPFASFGSGKDESDKVLYEYVKATSRDGRESIDFIRGMAALIRATNRSSDINLGVGGVPTISYFTKDGAKVLPEEESLLATEIVKVADTRMISETKAMNALEQLLLCDTNNCQAIEDDIFVKQTNYHDIMRFLRGYKPVKQ